MLLPVGIANCFLKRAWINGTMGIYSRNPRTSSAQLTKAWISWDRCWRTRSTCHYPPWKASRYLLGFVHTLSPVRFTFPWDGSDTTVVSCLEPEQRTDRGHMRIIPSSTPCLCLEPLLGDGGGATDLPAPSCLARVYNLRCWMFTSISSCSMCTKAS